MVFLLLLSNPFSDYRYF